MPSGVSDYGSSRWLSALFGVVPLPTRYYIALCTREPGSAMDGTMLAALEPTDPTYARQLYGTGEANWAVNGAYLTNLKSVSFPIPGEDWGYLTHYALCTAAEAGQIYSWGEFYNPQNVTRNVGMLVPPGGIVHGLHAQNKTIAA